MRESNLFVLQRTSKVMYFKKVSTFDNELKNSISEQILWKFMRLKRVFLAIVPGGIKLAKGRLTALACKEVILKTKFFKLASVKVSINIGKS